MADAVRIVVSLFVVAGACLATALLARRARGVVRGGLRVVSRVPVSKTSSLLVVSVGSRMLLVGAAEGSLRLLSELDPADLELVPAEASVALAPQAPRSTAFRARASVRSTDGPWTGLVRNLQRMTLRTTPEGPFRARKP